jgi:branched-chain amino acid aminotransferase
MRRLDSLAAMSVLEFASVDGAIVPTAEATIPLKDDGLYRGDGIFEVIRLYGGRPYALEDHLDRLERSAAAIELDAQRAALEPEIQALLEANGDTDAQLRLLVTRGGRRIALIEPLVEHTDTVSLATVSYTPTIVLTGVKSLSYGANMQATRIAKGKGADDALLVRPDGIVLEAPTSTIFWVSDGELRTPSLDAGILDSITRRVVVAAIDVAEGEYEREDLLGASEAFLASTVREIQPIAAVDDTIFDPGPVTERAREAFERAVAAELGTEA